ncbi:hypothetical protein MNBD_BACTEROID06-98, partial [hydrothermal vent metagenome]
ANNYGTSTQIGTAVSFDGNEWVEKKDAPVLQLGSPGAWDDTEVETPYVIYVPSNPDSMKYMMWYSGATTENNLFDTDCFGFPAIYQIGLAFSSDGLNWTKYNNTTNDSLPLFSESDPVLSIPSYNGCTPDFVNSQPEVTIAVAEPCVLYEEGIYKMYCIGLGSTDTSWPPIGEVRIRILYTESNDGINWDPLQVILDIGDSTDFDSVLVMSPDVIKIDQSYWMFYPGNTTEEIWAGTEIGLATSTDGINFIKDPNNPLLKRTPGASNAYALNGPSAILFNDTLRVYYSAAQDSFPLLLPTIGYSFLDSPLSTLIPESFDNSVSTRIYPNPFSYSTTIEFENIQNEIHTLILFDAMGQLVRITENISTGLIKFRRMNLASGLYFFQLWTDRQVIATGKLLIE